MNMNEQPNIVVIGGGTGSFTLLSGLKRYTSNITALVNMSDDGGSTGTLRDELGVLPPGDVRQCLVALSDTQKVRDLFTYRFDEGSLDGHSFGNLFISAVEKMTDSFEEAVAVASDVLRITGRVIPITLDRVTLIATMENGSKIVGEYKVGKISLSENRPRLSFDPHATIHKPALDAIMQADIVVIAPGNVYGSLAPALIVDGVGKALKKTKAKIVQVTNLVTKPHLTDTLKVADYAEEIERFCGVGNILDYVIFNTDEPTKQMRDKYVRDGEFMIEFDLEDMHTKHYRAVGLPLIDKSPIVPNKQDKIAHVRSLIRHDSDVVAREIMKIYFS
jgi:uncharacterized cofD-like protein